jgi:hypothetical protein
MIQFQEKKARQHLQATYRCLIGVMLKEGIRVIYLIDSYPDPINADEARNSIARNLISQANKSKIIETMQDLRAKAKIVVLSIY